MKEVNKEIKKIKHKFTATSEPKVLFKGRLKYIPNSRKITLLLNNHLVKDSIIGNMFAPIVRVVGLEDKPKSETIHREFTVPNYLPLRSSSFNEVILELTDDMGNSMKFNQGNSVAVFHFKKKGKI